MNVGIKKGRDGAELVEYLLDTGDGQFCRSRMPLSVMVEIASRSNEKKVDGDELVAGKYRFPLSALEVEGAARARRAKS